MSGEETVVTVLLLELRVRGDAVSWEGVRDESSTSDGLAKEEGTRVWRRDGRRLGVSGGGGDAIVSEDRWVGVVYRYSYRATWW